MIVENIACKTIRLSSVAFESAYNSSTLKEFQLTAYLNDSDPVTKNVDLTTLSNSWTVQFPIETGIFVKQIYARNILSGSLYPLLTGTYAATAVTASLLSTEIANEITTSLLNDLNVTATTSTSLVNGIAEIEVIDMPQYLVMETVITTFMDIESTGFFHFLGSEDIIFSNNAIFVLPSFFGLTTFTDGIYHFTSIVTTTSDILIEEQACFFVDCLMAGLLHKQIDLEKCDAAQMHTLLMHYSLTQGSNNTCDCDDLYKIYSYLAKILNGQKLEDCGCN